MTQTLVPFTTNEALEAGIATAERAKALFRLQALETKVANRRHRAERSAEARARADARIAALEKVKQRNCRLAALTHAIRDALVLTEGAELTFWEIWGVYSFRFLPEPGRVLYRDASSIVVAELGRRPGYGRIATVGGRTVGVELLNRQGEIMLRLGEGLLPRPGEVHSNDNLWLNLKPEDIPPHWVLRGTDLDAGECVRATDRLRALVAKPGGLCSLI